MVSIEMQNMIKLLKDSIANNEFSVKAIRGDLKKLSAIAPLSKDVKYKSINAGGVPAEWITTPGINEHNVILHLHAGYYIAGSIETERRFAAEIGRVCTV